jgi:hypothetical protein
VAFQYSCVLYTVESYKCVNKGEYRSTNKVLLFNVDPKGRHLMIYTILLASEDGCDLFKVCCPEFIVHSRLAGSLSEVSYTSVSYSV